MADLRCRARLAQFFEPPALGVRPLKRVVWERIEAFWQHKSKVHCACKLCEKAAAFRMRKRPSRSFLFRFFKSRQRSLLSPVSSL